jgi:hypothetical protein
MPNGGTLASRSEICRADCSCVHPVIRDEAFAGSSAISPADTAWMTAATPAFRWLVRVRHVPLAHWVWGGGFFGAAGVFDLAVVALVWSAVVTFLVLKSVGVFIPLRVTLQQELEAFDISQHGEAPQQPRDATVIPFSALEMGMVLAGIPSCSYVGHRCLSLGRHRKAVFLGTPPNREKARIHNPLGKHRRSGTAFDSTRIGCARVVKLSAW